MIPPSQPGTPRVDSHGAGAFPTLSHSSYFDSMLQGNDETTLLRGLLPDETWIAIVCGVSREQWNTSEGDEDDGLPDGFYVAPKDVYMPDLTVVADVLLGKLVSVYVVLQRRTQISQSLCF
jgi:hypothetical protein